MGTNMSARRNIMLLMAALSVLLSAACTEIVGPGDDGWTELGGDRPVNFSSSLATTATKTTSSLNNGTTFGVFAFYQPGTSGAPGSWNPSTRTPNFMFNQPVLFELTDSYTYTPVRYWPSNEYNTISFWAYCPYNANPDLLAQGTTNAYTNTSAGIPDIRFTTDGLIDLMVTDVVESQTYTSNATNNGVVPLTFNHVLSRIDVKAEKVDSDNKYTVTLKFVSFKGLYTTAILKSSDWSCECSGSRQDLAIWAEDPGRVLTHASPTLLKSVYHLPQSLSNDASRLSVEYSVSYYENPLDDSTLVSYSTTREAYLRDVFYSMGTAWTKNSHYTLTLRITPGNPIQFIVSWDSWGTDYNYNLSS